MRKITQEYKEVYCRIDVHKRSYSFSIWAGGQEVGRHRMDADIGGLIGHLKKRFPKARIRSVYEAGFSGYGLHRSLVAAGIENRVINPASVEMAANDRKKNDRLDARKLGEQLSLGRLKGIYIPSEAEEQRREITRVREQVVKSRTRVGAQIKMKMHYFGLIGAQEDVLVGPRFLKNLEARLKGMAEEVKFAFKLLIEQWSLLHKQLGELKIRMQEQSLEDNYKEEIYRSVPGIGPVGARVLANELGDLSKRFRNQRALYQYTGLTPSEHSSGEKIRSGSIDRQGSARIRALLVEASWRAIGGDPYLAKVFWRIANRRGKTRAIVAIARKLIGRIRSCFRTQSLYQINMA